MSLAGKTVNAWAETFTRCSNRGMTGLRVQTYHGRHGHRGCDGMSLPPFSVQCLSHAAGSGRGLVEIRTACPGCNIRTHSSQVVRPSINLFPRETGPQHSYSGVLDEWCSAWACGKLLGLDGKEASGRFWSLEMGQAVRERVIQNELLYVVQCIVLMITRAMGRL